MMESENPNLPVNANEETTGYAELSSMFPKSAAEYVFVKNAFKSNIWAFIAGWLIALTTKMSLLSRLRYCMAVPQKKSLNSLIMRMLML